MLRGRFLSVTLLCLMLFPAFVGAQEATPIPSAASPVAGAATGDECQVGRQEDGSVVLPTNQVITPAGRQVEFLGRPVDVAVRPDGRTAAFLTNSNPEPITVVDLATGAVTQLFDPAIEPGTASSSYAGIRYAVDGNTLYAADFTGSIYVADVAADGTLSLRSTISLGERETAPRPGGMTLSTDGATLYVALNSANALGVIDLATGALTDEIAVGNAPYGVVVVGTTAYVSNQGGRPAETGDTTNLSGGTEIVSDPVGGDATTGTVSVVDLVAGVETATIAVGLQPTAMLLHGETLFVTNTNSDTVSAIDTAANAVAKTIAVQVFPGAPFGSSPNSLAMIDDETLVVGLGRNNALAIYEWEGPDQAVAFQGLVPTGWYPASIGVNPTSQELVIANAKGVGSLGPEAEGGPEATNPTGMYVHSNQGSVSLIPFADLATEAMPAHTASVFQNNQWSGGRCGPLERGAAPDGTTAAPKAVPLRLGDPSPIKHVFYIIKENRTYDQVFGDLPQANGDPSLVQFGREVTPNQHALAEQYQIMDNLYVSGSLSADGHQWATQAFVVDYLEKAFGDFSRSYPFNGADPLAYAPSGFIWDNATEQGLSVRNYGEYCNGFTNQNDVFGEDFGDWETWWRDSQILGGEATGDLTYPLGIYQTTTDVPSLDLVTNREFPPYSTNIPDQYRAEIFLEEFAEYEENGNLPNLTVMLLPADHTSGTAPGFPTPRAQVADNDLAVGRIVEAITRSSYWPESAIFVIEDDAQNGVDHVDGHRSTGLVISPYAKRGIVASQYYTQIDFVRTIEQILGLPAMNQMDLAATPMWDLFTDTPDLTPFTALENQVPLDEMNPAESALTGVELAWAQTATAMGFADYEDIARGPDAKDENILNHAIWYGTKGFDIPYPGEDRVLWPHEVTPAPVSEDDELEEIFEEEGS